MPEVTAGIRISQEMGELPGGEVAVRFDPSESEVDFPGNEVAGFVHEECLAVIDVSWPLLFSLFDVPVIGEGVSLAGEGEASYDFFDERTGTLVTVDLFIDADNPANRGLWAAYWVRGPGDRRRLVWSPDGDVVQALFDTTGLCCWCRPAQCPGYRTMTGHVPPGELSAYQPGAGSDPGKEMTLAHGETVFAYLSRIGPATDAENAEASQKALGR